MATCFADIRSLVTCLGRVAAAGVLGVACTPEVEDLRTQFGEPCVTVIGGEASYHGDENCYQAFPLRTISGYWVVEFENSQLFRTRADLESNSNYAWLELSSKASRAADPVIRNGGRIYEVRFLGRESDMAGHFGHMSGYNRGVLVETFLILKPASELEKVISDLPPPPTTTD
jgi:hypothetical protein